MEAVIKKTISIEFNGKKYALQDDATIEDLLVQIGFPKDKPVKLLIQKDGAFLLLP